jgi:RNA polymerase sigma factor (sigma-70 family)
LGSVFNARAVMGQDEDEVGLGALLTEGRVVEMLRFGRVLTGDRYSAEDLVQDVLVALFERGANLPPIANWGGYTRRMMVNRYVSLHRKSSRGRPVELLWSSEPTESEPVDYAVTTRDELGAALAQLPPRQRAALVLRYYSDLGDEEIASTLRCTASTVRSHISRGLQALRIGLTEESNGVPGK